MTGVKGKIIRSGKRQRRTVYLSNFLGMWTDGRRLHLTMQKGRQNLHTSISPGDGMVYFLLRGLWEYGMQHGETSSGETPR
ncbi:MAG: hypothetical protein COV76_04460 [Candidatus Omnitrophica bacterium CG11_big_fil_rev_8_21_14_0_20_64_10]|nr:MAG: hypothetical protein COV76_04460 [Candidatus Omnitrophica bacterium CG11_big_fil_rev_8_21_14_0_20_64_10]